MTKNKIHCLIIKEPRRPKHTLNGMFESWEGKVFAEVIDNTSNSIIKKLLTGNISLVITSSNNKHRLENYRNLLRRYSNDTILINQSVKNRTLLRDISGIESCSINLGDAVNTPVIINNLLSYTQMKNDFRQCKHLLSVTDQRNRWLVNITHEPIAYIYKSTHIHANAAYLSIFGFKSTAELKSTSIWDLVPQKSHKMFQNFIKKQRRNMDMKQTLLMTMNTTDKNQIRSGIRIAPAVLNKTKCLQLWVHKIDEGLGSAENKAQNRLERHGNKEPVSPWENLPEKKMSLSTNTAINDKPQQSHDPIKSQARNQSSKLSNELKQNLNTIKLRLQPLTDTHTQTINHYLASLEFGGSDQTRITVELTNSGITKTAIFWDRLLLGKLSKELSGNQQSKNQYLIYIAETSFSDDNFMNFLFKKLKTLSNKHPHIVFLVPQSIYTKHDQRITKVRNVLITMNSSLGTYNVVPEKVPLQKLLKHKPSYLEFSSNWIKKLPVNTKQYQQFMRLTEKLEATGIQVIL